MLKNGKSLDFKRFSGVEKVHRNSIKITADFVVDLKGFEPSTSRMRTERSPS